MPHSELHKTKLKKNLTVLAIIFAAVALFWIITMIKIGKAEASELVFCGAPLSSNVNVEPAYDHCDMYTRQLAFREESIALRQTLLQRAENYAAPRKQSRENYKRQLEALHDSISEDSVFTLTPKD